MFYDERMLAVRQEQLKDQQRRADHRKLLQDIQAQRQYEQTWQQNISGWVGSQMKKMKKWGTTLQQGEPVLSPKAMSQPDC